MNLETVSPASIRATDTRRRCEWEIDSKILGGRLSRRGHLLIFRDVTGLVRKLDEHLNALEQVYESLTSAQDTQKRTEQQIFYYSLHDSLTALANRSLLLSRLSQSMELYRLDAAAPYTLVGIDLVNFRAVNDLHGYREGDSLLRQLSQRLKDCLREIDLAARITADRFYVILNGTNETTTILAVVERIRGRLEAPLVLGNSSYLPRAKYAIVLGEPSAVGPETVIDDAETTLKRTKDENQADIMVFEPAWRERRKENRLLLDDLSRAFSTRQITLAYQPIVDAQTYQVRGLEALIRWKHPTLGRIDPARMIALAESEGLIAPLGLWALREASAFLQRLTDAIPAATDLYISVNVSPKQLRDPEFSTIILAILGTTGLSPSRLHLEITESSLVVHSESVVPHLETLRALGTKIKMDDFGTGYSSLQSLQELPIDTIKVDRAFVERLPDSQPILLSVFELAKKLGLDSITEGVETKQQLSQLQELGCQQIQGFLFSKALEESQILALAPALSLVWTLIPSD